MSFSRPRRARALQVLIATILTRCTSMGSNIGWAMSRPNLAAAPSAATPIGAVPSGSRQFSDYRVPAKIPSLFRRRIPGRMPDGLGAQADALASRGLSVPLARVFFCAMPRAAPGVRLERAISVRSPLARTCVSYEYFHGDNGAGLGATHQTGWTALVAKLIEQSGGSTQVAQITQMRLVTIMIPSFAFRIGGADCRRHRSTGRAVSLAFRGRAPA